MGADDVGFGAGVVGAVVGVLIVVVEDVAVVVVVVVADTDVAVVVDMFVPVAVAVGLVVVDIVVVVVDIVVVVVVEIVAVDLGPEMVAPYVDPHIGLGWELGSYNSLEWGPNIGPVWVMSRPLGRWYRVVVDIVVEFGIVE